MGVLASPVTFDPPCGSAGVDTMKEFSISFAGAVYPGTKTPDIALLPPAGLDKNDWVVKLVGNRILLGPDGHLSPGVTYIIEASSGQKGLVDACGRELAPFVCNFTT